MLRRINIALLALQWTVCMAGDKEEAGTWQYVTASNPPFNRQSATAVIDAQQRIWIFGGSRYEGRQGVVDYWTLFNDLHYFDTQATAGPRAWHGFIVSNALSVSHGHASVIDAQQRIWVVGGYTTSNLFSDLHYLYYFDIQAKVWHRVSAQNAPPVRHSHTAVMDAKQRMWIFGGGGPPGQNSYNDLHYFDIQAKTWQEVKASNPPSRRYDHTAVMDAQQRMWIFGGLGGSGTLHYFDIQAKTWQEVKASNAPSKTKGHTAVMDAQQRMWIFGGGSGDANNLHYFDIQAKTWQQVNASNPFARSQHTAVMDMQQRMWIFGGDDGKNGFRSWNDLHYFDTQVITSSTTVTTSKTTFSSTFTTSKTSKTTYTRTTTSTSSSTSASTSASTSITSEDMTSSSTSTISKKVALADSMQPQAEEDTQIPTTTTGKAEHFLVGEPLQTSWALDNVNVGEDPLGAEAPRPDDDDSMTLFVVGIVLSVLLACLFVFLGFGIYRCYRARKLRQGAPEEPQSSPIWPVLPTITSITSITATPLLFGWDSRMTAEWPRGKVLKLTVGETGFEGKGQRFPFRQADGREFCWEDGTVQRAEKIQKNVVWWRTQHERSEWQHFRWICTPKCSVGGHHDMELTEVDPYRCSSCSSSRVAEKHWHCPSHKVHLCPSCAELPPETPTLGVAANYVVNVFPTLASSATGQENPDFYAICPLFAHGSNGLGVNKICPRDGRPQCSVVDALEDTYSGKVTHFVSWCWAYYLQSVVSAVEGWLHKSGEDPHDVFLWMCFFCNNQYRIKEATKTGSEDLKSIFESHLVEAGRMLVLLETIERPVYITRAWCIFESYVCIARDIPMSIILPETAASFFRETVQTGEISMLTKAVGALNVRDAKASSEADEDLIKRLILNDIGFDRVNKAVRSKLVDSFMELFRELFMEAPAP